MTTFDRVFLSVTDRLVQFGEAVGVLIGGILWIGWICLLVAGGLFLLRALVQFLIH